MVSSVETASTQNNANNSETQVPRNGVVYRGRTYERDCCSPANRMMVMAGSCYSLAYYLLRVSDTRRANDPSDPNSGVPGLIGVAVGVVGVGCNIAALFMRGACRRIF